MIDLSNFMLNGKFLGGYTIRDMKKVCRKNKKQLYLQFFFHDVSRLNPEEVNLIYSKVVDYFTIEFEYTGRIILDHISGRF